MSSFFAVKLDVFNRISYPAIFTTPLWYVKFLRQRRRLMKKIFWIEPAIQQRH